MSNAMGWISQIQRFCTHDGPGIRTTAFLTGCPLGCIWCHNPECSLHADKTYAPGTPLASAYMSSSALAHELSRDEPFYGDDGGVTLSGGEPLMQTAFTKAVLSECATRGLHTAIETSLCAQWETVSAMLPYVRLWIVDIKAMDSEKHRLYTGRTNHRILENMNLLLASGSRIWVRMPIVPGVHEGDDIRALAAYLSEHTAVEQIELIPFHLLGREKYAKLGVVCPYPTNTEPSPAYMQALARILRDAGLPVYGDKEGEKTCQ